MRTAIFRMPLATLTTVVMLLIMLFSQSASAQAPSTAQLIAAAPVLQILLDNSGSSPATDEQIIARAWPLIESKVRAMPPASIVIVHTVGTAELPPISLRLRIQQRRTSEGGTMNDVVQAIRTAVLSFPAKIKAGTVAQHGTSNLIAGLFDASRAINPASDSNVIIFISDLIENSSLANCYTSFPCKLPKPEFSLPGTELIVLGVGWGLPANKEIALVKSWEQYLGKLGLPKPAQLKTKTFG